MINDIKTDLNTRVTHVFREGEWHVTPLCEVKAGEKFRLFESDGSLVLYDDIGEYLATSDGFIDSTGLHGIQWGPCI